MLTAAGIAGCGGDDDGSAGGPPASGGEDIFVSQGCAGCHALDAAQSTGTIGPDLDTALAGQAPAEVRQSIIDPDARIAPWFPEGVMPSDYGERLNEGELQELVQFLVAATSGSEDG